MKFTQYHSARNALVEEGKAPQGGGTQWRKTSEEAHPTKKKRQIKDAGVLEFSSFVPSLKNKPHSLKKKEKKNKPHNKKYSQKDISILNQSSNIASRFHS